MLLILETTRPLLIVIRSALSVLRYRFSFLAKPSLNSRVAGGLHTIPTFRFSLNSQHAKAKFPSGDRAADELGARIRGAIVDPSGAGVPDAQVTATNASTHASVTVPTSPDGTFQFLTLPVGKYDVTVAKPGFRNYTTRNITLDLNQVYDLRASLELGQVSDSVQVEANPSHSSRRGTTRSTRPR
jgi:hypothetical protein